MVMLQDVLGVDVLWQTVAGNVLVGTKSRFCCRRPGL